MKNRTLSLALVILNRDAYLPLIVEDFKSFVKLVWVRKSFGKRYKNKARTADLTALKILGTSCAAISLPSTVTAFHPKPVEPIRLGVIADLHGRLATDGDYDVANSSSLVMKNRSSFRPAFILNSRNPQ